MFDWESVHSLQAAIFALIGAVLVIIGRISVTRKRVVKDSIEGGLYTHLLQAVKHSEDRRTRESEMYREREEEHERRHIQNSERMMNMAAEVATLKATVQAMERQLAELLRQLENKVAHEALMNEIRMLIRQTWLPSETPSTPPTGLRKVAP